VVLCVCKIDKGLFVYCFGWCFGSGSPWIRSAFGRLDPDPHWNAADPDPEAKKFTKIKN
jgi:hypothetical protein